jgi:mannose-6-phosphate isomerase-like protein (cupin superfamily)
VVILASVARAADASATVTEVHDEVTRGAAQGTGSVPAKVGTHVANGEYLKTGAKARAELQFPDLTITRMGANTIFNYSLTNNEVDLQSGTILFSKPKDGKELDIKTSSVTAAILGTTGFLSLHGHDYTFGLIEGHARLIIGGKSVPVGGGQVLHIDAGGLPQVFAFDVPLLVQTSPLMTQFQSTLPNQVYINQAVSEYNDLAARGFIQKPQPPYLGNGGGSLPGVTIVAFDSAGNAVNNFYNPPPTPPPPPGGSNP